mgnify:CR=1 FL=1|tara:strand:- start:14670 stop:15146 length:477 start_codon:yes stop_codon:yes gene_type:complete
MKKDGFVKLLRRIIREEVRNAVKAELKPLLNEVDVKNHDINLHEVMDTPNIKKQPVSKKQYTKNPMLNDLLNETANTPASQELTDWSKMEYKSDMAEAFGDVRKKSGPAMPLTTKGINGERIDMNNEAVATTVNAMTKDYSALIKAIDKKNGKMGTIK